MTSRYVKQSGSSDKGRGGGTRRRPYKPFIMNNDSPKFAVLIGALILFLFLLLGSYTAGAQDSTITRQPLELTYHAFSNVRSTNLGTTSNTDLYLGTKSGNVSIGVGYVRQIYNANQRTTDFQAFTPQARIGFGTANFFYMGPATTIYRVDDYIETGYGLELGLFITH